MSAFWMKWIQIRQTSSSHNQSSLGSCFWSSDYSWIGGRQCYQIQMKNLWVLNCFSTSQSIPHSLEWSTGKGNWRRGCTPIHQSRNNPGTHIAATEEQDWDPLCVTNLCVALRYIVFHCVTLCYIVLHCVALCYIVLCYVTLHWITLHWGSPPLSSWT